MRYEAKGMSVVGGYLLLSFLPPLPLIALALTMMGLYGQNSSEYSFQTLAIVLGAAILIMSAFVCLFVFGPVWLVLHKLGFRTRWHACVAATVVFGLVYTYIAWVGYSEETETNGMHLPGIETLEFWFSLVLPLSVISLIYGGVAMIAWRVAYRRVLVDGA